LPDEYHGHLERFPPHPDPVHHPVYPVRDGHADSLKERHDLSPVLDNEPDEKPDPACEHAEDERPPFNNESFQPDPRAGKGVNDRLIDSGKEIFYFCNRASDPFDDGIPNTDDDRLNLVPVFDEQDDDYDERDDGENNPCYRVCEKCGGESPCSGNCGNESGGERTDGRDRSGDKGCGERCDRRDGLAGKRHREKSRLFDRRRERQREFLYTLRSRNNGGFRKGQRVPGRGENRLPVIGCVSPRHLEAEIKEANGHRAGAPHGCGHRNNSANDAYRAGDRHDCKDDFSRYSHERFHCVTMLFHEGRKSRFQPLKNGQNDVPDSHEVGRPGFVKQIPDGDHRRDHGNDGPDCGYHAAERSSGHGKRSEPDRQHSERAEKCEYRAADKKQSAESRDDEHNSPQRPRVFFAPFLDALNKR